MFPEKKLIHILIYSIMKRKAHLCPCHTHCITWLSGGMRMAKRGILRKYGF